jgi:L-ascorbate metabolism protein UlaG (beta-lactamase superfamily)
VPDLAEAPPPPGTLLAVRNATLLLALTASSPVLLVDPMLNAEGAVAPVEHTAPPDRNPLVALPVPAEGLVAAAGAVLVTHLHNDHFDDGARRLLDPSVPILCQPADRGRLGADGFTDVRPVEDRLELAGELGVRRVPARHSLGEHEAALAPVSGYVLDAPGAPRVYVAGDCVWCPELAATLDAQRPDVIVVNAGAARFLTGEPISMTAEDVVRTARRAPWAAVVVVHLEALNHCPMRRDDLRRQLVAAGLGRRVVVPGDGSRLVLADLLER